MSVHSRDVQQFLPTLQILWYSLLATFSLSVAASKPELSFTFMLSDSTIRCLPKQEHLSRTNNHLNRFSNIQNAEQKVYLTPNEIPYRRIVRHSIKCNIIWIQYLPGLCSKNLCRNHWLKMNKSAHLILAPKSIDVLEINQISPNHHEFTPDSGTVVLQQVMGSATLMIRVRIPLIAKPDKLINL